MEDATLQMAYVNVPEVFINTGCLAAGLLSGTAGDGNSQ